MAVKPSHIFVSPVAGLNFYQVNLKIISPSRRSESGKHRQEDARANNHTHRGTRQLQPEQP